MFHVKHSRKGRFIMKGKVNMIFNNKVIVKLVVQDTKHGFPLEYPLVYEYTNEKFAKSFSVDHLSMWQRVRRHIALMEVKKDFQRIQEPYEKLISIEAIS